MKVCIVGLGQIGFPVAQYVHLKGHEVYGYDINPRTVENTIKTGHFAASDVWENVPAADVFVVCVTTGQVDNCPDLNAVFDVCRKIADRASTNTLVSIESTIIPGTCRKIFEAIFDRKVQLIHAPHRYWADEPEKHGVNQMRVIGAVNPESLKSGLKFYKEKLGIQMHAVSNVEVAEMCKITENSHRYLQIAFAEELAMMCSKIGLSFDELREACNTKWNVDIPEAREGIGRHCLPKDIRYVLTLAPSVILESAINADNQYREWLAKQR